MSIKKRYLNKINYSKKSNKMKKIKILLIMATITLPVMVYAQHQNQSAKGLLKDNTTQNLKMTVNTNDPQINKSATLTMPGNEIFGTIQEVVQKLEIDPNTDWSKVDLEALRQHLLDMKAFTEDVSVISQNPIENGIVIQVKPETERAIGALKRLFKMHPAMLKMEKGWDMITKQDNNQWTITVTTSDNSEVEEIRALGYIGLLAVGAHHQRHHWMIATGQMKNALK